jgi:hypothetical protein
VASLLYSQKNKKRGICSLGTQLMCCLHLLWQLLLSLGPWEPQVALSGIPRRADGQRAQSHHPSILRKFPSPRGSHSGEETSQWPPPPPALSWALRK